jgi:hypothetical protein
LILEWARVDPAGGRLVTKVASAQHDAASQSVTLTTIFEEGEPGRLAERWIRIDRMRLTSADELRGFAEDAGLIVETVAGGYAMEPIGAGGDRAVLVAVRP